MSRLLFFSALVLLVTACSDSNQTGHIDPKWDRDACQRCQMMLSDRNFSAQVRVFPQNKRSQVYKFDDLGCAVLWLDQKKWKDDPQTEIWVNDYKTRLWIDARKAWYIKDQISPMGYGLGAQSEKVEGALDFVQAKKHIYEVEEKLNIHGGNLD